MKLITWATLLLAAFTLQSCEYPQMTAAGMPDTQYHKTLQTQTKYQRLYGLDKTLYDTYITHYNPELAQLYVQEYEKIFSPSEVQKKVILSDQADATTYDEFMVGHFASDNDNQRLNTTDQQRVIWKFFLKADDGSMVEATNITPITLGPQLEYFYPFLNAWSRLYRIRFPKNNSATKTLVMKGPIRELTFVWK